MVELRPEDPAIPCGLVAKSYFNDQYRIYNTTDGERVLLEMDDSDIAWASDKESMFKNVPQDFDDLKMLGQ